MANNVTADQTKAFEEAFALSGSVVVIGGSNVDAIVPEDGGETQEFDENGVLQFVGENTITVKTSDLPTITATTTVTIGAVVYRINSIQKEGSICKRLEIETP